MKDILQCPRDEASVTKLNQLIQAVRQEIEAETLIYLTSDDEIEQMARAIERCTSKYYDELDDGCRLPKGSRLMIESKSRRKVAELLRSLHIGQQLKVKMRPLGTCREPPLDPFARQLMKTPYKNLRDLTLTDTIEEVRDKLLLSLWDALFLTASETWTKDGVASGLT